MYGGSLLFMHPISERYDLKYASTYHSITCRTAKVHEKSWGNHCTEAHVTDGEAPLNSQRVLRMHFTCERFEVSSSLCKWILEISSSIKEVN